MVTEPLTSATTRSLFLTSTPGSVLHKVYKNNMDEKSFVELDSVLPAVLSNYKTAGFVYQATGLSSKEYLNCQVGNEIILNKK